MENLEEQILDEELDNVIDKPWPIAFKYGVIGGMVFVLIELIKYSLGMMDVEQITNPSTAINLIIGFILAPLSWIVYAILYFLAIKNYREELGGFISFGKGFKVSFFSVLAKAAVIFIWGMFYYFLINPNYCQAMLDLMGETLSQNGIVDSGVTSMYSMLYNPFSLTLSSVLWTIAGGTLLSLLAAAIGKKSRMSN
jgi:hypothetical protein